MNLSTGNWIAIIGIGVAIIFGVIQAIKPQKSQSQKNEINQNSGPFSKGSQTVNISNSQTDKNE